MLGFPNSGLVVGVMVALAGLIAGCGGGSPQSMQTTGGVAGATKSSATPSTMFGTANVAGVGTVLVDGRGRTVYILTADGHTNLSCTGSSGCTKIWPNLPLPSGTSAAKAKMGAKAALLATKTLSDGRTYPTYDGWLIYEYTGDSGPGQADGEGLKSFGGTWYVLNPSGHPITSKSGGSGSTGGSGGGY